MYTVSILGAGNVATHLSRHLHDRGCRINCVWSKSQEHAVRLADELGECALWGDQLVPDGSDFYILALSDEAISEVVDMHAGHGGIWLHTAGSVDMKIFEGRIRNHGVLYPLQSLSREKDLVLEEVPLLLEASSPETMEHLRKLAGSISDVLRETDSARRLIIHMAAVFANNFSNHMVHLASKILEESGEDFAILRPLLEEGHRKILSHGPAIAQTGPARRGDVRTMEKHLASLEAHPEWEKLYTFVSRSIQDEQF